MLRLSCEWLRARRDRIRHIETESCLFAKYIFCVHLKPFDFCLLSHTRKVWRSDSQFVIVRKIFSYYGMPLFLTNHFLSVLSNECFIPELQLFRRWTGFFFLFKISFCTLRKYMQTSWIISREINNKREQDRVSSSPMHICTILFLNWTFCQSAVKLIRVYALIVCGKKLLCWIYYYTVYAHLQLIFSMNSELFWSLFYFHCTKKWTYWYRILNTNKKT